MHRSIYAALRECAVLSRVFWVRFIVLICRVRVIVAVRVAAIGKKCLHAPVHEELPDLHGFVKNSSKGGVETGKIPRNPDFDGRGKAGNSSGAKLASVARL